MARVILIGIVLSLVLSLTAGCGMAKEEYDSMASELSKEQAELGKAQQELHSVRVELEQSQAEISELTSNLEGVKAELEAAQANSSELASSLEKNKAELEETKSEYASFKSGGQRLYGLIAGNLALNEAILDVNGALLLKDNISLSKAAATVKSKLSSLRDIKTPELKALWEETYKLEGGQSKLYYAPFDKFMDMNAARIRVKAKALREHLAK
ncbi:hypothetical protein ACFLW8_04110 [Chloroflexota bacterium]